MTALMVSANDMHGEAIMATSRIGALQRICVLVRSYRLPNMTLCVMPIDPCDQTPTPYGGNSLDMICKQNQSLRSSRLDAVVGSLGCEGQHRGFSLFLSGGRIESKLPSLSQESSSSVRCRYWWRPRHAFACCML